jgi:predicted homoserine dehydrogenase-like protein
MGAADSLAQNCLPLGLAHGWKLLRAIPAGSPVKWSDVAVDANSTAVRVRREMEARGIESLATGRAGAGAEKVLAGRAR